MRLGGAVAMEAKGLAGEGIAVLAGEDRGDAVDEQMDDAGGVLGGVVESGDVADLIGVEDDEVGVGSFAEDAAIGESEDLGG